MIGLHAPEALARAAWSDGFALPPAITLTQWAERFLVLTSKQASEPGRYRMSRTPYLREIAENLSVSSRCERIVVMKGARLGLTQLGIAWVGYVIHVAPGPMLCVQPTVDVAKKMSRIFIAPMISASKELSRLVVEAKTRYGSNTILQKEFPGGVLTITGANSAVGLRHLSARYLFPDEIDGYPPDVAGEGDPLDLAIKRTDTFSGNRKIFMCSTPTVRGFSRIESAYEESDKRVYEIPCPHCGTFQQILWAQIRWPAGNPAGAVLACVACDAEINEGAKEVFLAAGRWTPTAEGDGRTVGYHLSALYSPLGWYSWESAVRDFLSAKARGIEALKAWTNTVLGETWEEAGESVDEGILAGRVEMYPGDVRVPAGGLVLTCGADVQDDRVELEVVGWGLGEESWGVDYRVIWGDPASTDLWAKVYEALCLSYRRESGPPLRIACTCVDSGGHYTQQVYAFCRGRQSERIFAIKGFSGAGRPVAAAPQKRRTGHDQRHVELFQVGTDQARGIVQGRLRLTAHGPGFCHFPADGHGYGPEYFRQLTSLKVVTRYSKGIPRREWVLQAHRRKEAFDCRVYALAALYILNPAWEALAKRRVQNPKSAKPNASAAQPAVKKRPVLTRPRKSWVNRW